MVSECIQFPTNNSGYFLYWQRRVLFLSWVVNICNFKFYSCLLFHFCWYCILVHVWIKHFFRHLHIPHPVVCPVMICSCFWGVEEQNVLSDLRHSTFQGLKSRYNTGCQWYGIQQGPAIPIYLSFREIPSSLMALLCGRNINSTLFLAPGPAWSTFCFLMMTLYLIIRSRGEKAGTMGRLTGKIKIHFPLLCLSEFTKLENTGIQASKGSIWFRS